MSLTIGCVTPTLCNLLGIDVPEQCTAQPASLFPNGKTPVPITKALVFVADAIGTRLIAANPASFAAVERHAPLRVDVQSVMPSITPVCMASMFTGAAPEAHGIRTPERRVLSCDTLFDALTRGALRVAIVAVEGSSIDLIFRNRPIDYFSERYDPEVTERMLSIIEQNEHDVILAYQQEYDDKMHATTPLSPESLRALHNHLQSFDVLAAAARRRWKGSAHAIAFLSDHGVHVDSATGHGTHGSDLPEDLDVTHFWGVYDRF
jgi:predicted AlkP superfamily pyrophosphatase or phosphodiesterase